MPRLLFILHGMGVHDANWAEPTVRHIARIPAEYGYSFFEQSGPLETHVTLAPISYDVAFTDLLTQWAESADELEAFADTHGADIGRCLSFLRNASPTENRFFWTSVVDVLMYRFFSIVSARVKLIVREEIVRRFNQEAAAGAIVDVSVLAHSLGTAVAHDSLSVLATQPIMTPAGPNRAFMTGNFQFKRIFQVANVSRVLQTDPGVLASPIHPFTFNPSTSYTRGYLNFRHRFDVFPAVQPFTPHADWKAGYMEPGGVRRILGFNVHDLDLYLDDPRVHIPLLRQLIGPEVVSPDEEVAALAQYDAKAEPQCIAELEAFKDRVDSLIHECTSGDLEDLIIGVTRALASAKEAKDACV